jgi:hypothetical protein
MSVVLSVCIGGNKEGLSWEYREIAALRNNARRRLPRLLFSLRVILIAACLGAPYAFGAGTHLQFDERTLSLGECDQGTTVKGVVTFRNPTSQAVRLTGVSGACSCTVVDFSQNEIFPGATGTFTVSISTRQRLGKVDNDLTVNYDLAGVKRSDKVVVTVFVRAEGKLVAQPETIYFGYLAPGAPVQTTVDIRHLQYARRPTHIRSVSSPRWLQAQLREMPGAEPTWQLSVTGTVPDDDGRGAVPEAGNPGGAEH